MKEIGQSAVKRDKLTIYTLEKMPDKYSWHDTKNVCGALGNE